MLRRLVKKLLAMTVVADLSLSALESANLGVTYAT